MSPGGTEMSQKLMQGNRKCRNVHANRKGRRDLKG